MSSPVQAKLFGKKPSGPVDRSKVAAEALRKGEAIAQLGAGTLISLDAMDGNITSQTRVNTPQSLKNLKKISSNLTKLVARLQSEVVKVRQYMQDVLKRGAIEPDLRHLSKGFDTLQNALNRAASLRVRANNEMRSTESALLEEKEKARAASKSQKKPV